MRPELCHCIKITFCWISLLVFTVFLWRCICTFLANNFNIFLVDFILSIAHFDTFFPPLFGILDGQNQLRRRGIHRETLSAVMVLHHLKRETERERETGRERGRDQVTGRETERGQGIGRERAHQVTNVSDWHCLLVSDMLYVEIVHNLSFIMRKDV